MENMYDELVDKFLDMFDFDGFDNLDDAMESEEFKKQAANLKPPVDMQYNLDYLNTLHAEGSTDEERKEAMNNLVVANMNLVNKVVSRYVGAATTSFDEEDMKQEGMRGLIKAADRFDASKENRFSTYAVWWIRQSISRAIQDTSKTIRIPVHMQEKASKYNKFQKSFRRMNGRKATDEEAATELEFSLDDINNIKYCNGISHLTSLSNPVGDDQSTTIIEFIEDYRYKTPEESAEETDLSEVLESMISSSLNEREQKIINARFGLHCARIYTLEEIGEEFHVTRERIRQIEAKALRKLQSRKNLERLEDYLYA